MERKGKEVMSFRFPVSPFLAVELEVVCFLIPLWLLRHARVAYGILYTKW
uniref:Uncharacterized protein n=1 Tax=Anguilla anguilla TaxID=7936 RepID=A0A0E9RRX3_ANGAN